MVGEGGNLTLVNATPVAWNRTSRNSYQLNSWNPPDKINSFTSNTQYIEWNTALWIKRSDSGAEAVYQLEGTNLSFQLQARYLNGGFHIQIVLKNIQVQGYGQSSTIDLGWSHNGFVSFMLSGSPTDGFFCGLPNSADWMQTNLSIFGSLTLQQLCIPGSHDAGMSRCTNQTIGANAGNVQTQTKTVGGQLNCGSRYFDIRPIIGSGAYCTGHYSYVNPTLGTQGGRGQPIPDIINDINTFTSKHKELIILKLSHSFNTDKGRNYPPFNAEEWQGLFQLLSGISNLFIGTPATDLTSLPLKSYIGNQKAAVIILMDDQRIDWTNLQQVAAYKSLMGSYYEGKGFFPISALNIYDDYSDTDKVNQMITDQTKKLIATRTPSTLFLLSWTLTQNNFEAVASGSGVAKTVLQLADTANQKLVDIPKICWDNKSYPNIIYIDKFENPTPLSISLAITYSQVPRETKTIVFSTLDTKSIIRSMESNSGAVSRSIMTRSVARSITTSSVKTHVDSKNESKLNYVLLPLIEKKSQLDAKGKSIAPSRPRRTKRPAPPTDAPTSRPSKRKAGGGGKKSIGQGKKKENIKILEVRN